MMIFSALLWFTGVKRSQALDIDMRFQRRFLCFRVSLIEITWCRHRPTSNNTGNAKRPLANRKWKHLRQLGTETWPFNVVSYVF